MLLRLLAFGYSSTHNYLSKFQLPNSRSWVDQRSTFTHHPMNEIHCGLSIWECFRTLGLWTSKIWNFGPREFPDLFLPTLSTSEIPIYFTPRAYIIQLSPTKVVGHGRSKNVHVTYGDVIESHPTCFLFQSFRHREFVHPHISFLPIIEILKIWSTFCLIQQLNFHPLIYGVDISWDF
jgi:hypothetical protein